MMNKNKNDENNPYLEFIEVVLLHYDIANNDYQRDSIVLYTFIRQKLFGQLFNNSLQILSFYKPLVQ